MPVGDLKLKASSAVGSYRRDTAKYGQEGKVMMSFIARAAVLLLQPSLVRNLVNIIIM